MLLRAAAGAVVVARLARRPLQLRPRPDDRPGSVSVVVPARNEAERIGPLLAAVTVDPQVEEVVVVDDESTDGTADLARAAGARVVEGRPLPPGWVGKPWALQQGLEATTTGWILLLDADVVPQPGLVGALVAEAEREGWDLLSCGARFVCETVGERLLHPSMLATLVYRFGAPAGRSRRPLANGQCVLVRRRPLLAAGGFGPIAGHLTDDVALAQHLTALGWRVGFLDGSHLLDVRMHTSAGDVWRNWGRSLPMPDVTPPATAAADLAVVWLALALPLPRLVARRGDRVDIALVALRLGLLAATAGAYRRRGVAYWLSPLADLPVAARITWGTVRPGRTWRGRTYPPARTAPR